jgi:tungstate transport system substrate-binding protein
MKLIKFSILFLIFSSSLLSREYIILQSTTSTANTGLLETLSDSFYKETGIEVRAISVGTGTAIQNAKRGDGDVLLVHSKSDEIEFVEEGYGVERFELMYNDFVIVGPSNDPAKIENARSLNEVMRILHSSESKFISRDDNSGTHKKELFLWKKANLASPLSNSYIKTGTGMANTLNIAAEMQGYTLTDRGTWTTFTNKKNLKILFDKDEALYNPYGVIAINPVKFPHVEYKKSQTFIDWLISGNGKLLIKNYEVNKKKIFFINE